MGKLYYSIGLPRSGKSTLAGKWVRDNIDIYDDGKIEELLCWEYKAANPRIVVNSDAIRLAMHGQVYAANAEGQVAVTAEMMMRMFLSEGYDVFYDETNTSVDSLKRIYRVSRDAIPVIINTTMDVCIERALKLNQEYLVPVIKRCSLQKDALLANFDETVKGIKDYLKTHN